SPAESAGENGPPPGPHVDDDDPRVPQAGGRDFARGRGFRPVACYRDLGAVGRHGNRDAGHAGKHAVPDQLIVRDVPRPSQGEGVDSRAVWLTELVVYRDEPAPVRGGGDSLEQAHATPTPLLRLGHRVGDSPGGGGAYGQVAVPVQYHVV